jgi:glycogen debranching enzyme
MAKQRDTDRRTGNDPHLPPAKRRRRKQDLLTHGIPSMARSIAEAIVIKDEDLFFLCEQDGGVPAGGRHGFGLYRHDCRFLNAYELTMNGQRPEPLVASSLGGYSAMFELTNPDLRVEGEVISKQTVGIRWQRVIASGQLALEDALTFTNYGIRAVEFPFEVSFGAGFEDIFEVRGFLTGARGKLRSPSWRGNVLRFLYRGADGIFRSTHIHFSRRIARKFAAGAQFRLRLGPGESAKVQISATVAEARDLHRVRRETHAPLGVTDLRKQIRRRADAWVQQHTEVRSGSRVLNLALDRSLRDLGVLRSRLDGSHYFAAGTPWFATLFGRDSIITAIETLAYDPSIAEQTLRLLAEFQGHKVDQWRDEQPGKILHELRVGELAHLGEIPHTPYYGTIDATPLFLVLAGLHARWTGSLRLFHDLRANIDRALEWIDRYGDLDGDGYVEYQSQSHKGLVNQGWKDSGDAIMNADGSLAEPPIALVEVQGYVYWAKKEMADLFRRAGEAATADRLDRAAEALRPAFNRDFWLADKGIYALALQRDHRPAAVVSSNPGQALWTGIVDPRKARLTMERLMAPDMFSGWGIRTLSSREARYNPIGYHLGTVWPHDNALIAGGFRRYGFDQAARRIFDVLLEASVLFPESRMPEAFAGLARGAYGVPVKYPVACHPQAWAAGAFPYLLQTALGLIPEAFDNRLRIVRPILPELVPWVELRRLRVGRARADLRFEQRTDGDVSVEVLRRTHELDVVVEPETAARQTAAKEKKVA